MSSPLNMGTFAKLFAKLFLIQGAKIEHVKNEIFYILDVLSVGP